MTLTLTLSPETEAKLTARARALGKAPEAVALEAIDERLAAESDAPTNLSVSERLKQFDAWVGSHQSRNPNLDDSRESFYPDRW
jgi:hypothetical protein